MKLDIELVPKPLWNVNLRFLVPDHWEKIRHAVYRKAKFKCSVCRATGILHAHEVWSYDDTKNIQSLEAVVCLCEMCHKVKHIGLASIQNGYEDVVNHFCAVNKCKIEKFYAALGKAKDDYNRRSAKQWVTNMGKYNQIVMDLGLPSARKYG